MQCEVLSPEVIACSGNGVCNVSLGVCVCEAGWSGLGEFALSAGADCDIDVLAVRVLWAIEVGLEFVAVGVDVRYFFQKIRFNKAAFENKSLGELMRDAMIMFPFWFLVYSCVAIVLGFLRLFFTEERVIGGDVGVTFLWFLFLVTIMFGGVELVKAFASFLMGILKIMPESIKNRVRIEGRITEKFLPFLRLAIVVFSAMALPIVWYPHMLLIFSGIHFIGVALVTFMFAYLILLKSLAPVIHEIQKHVNNASAPDSGISKVKLDEIKVVLFKLKLAFALAGPSLLMTAMICTLFGSWPFFLRKTSYLIPVIFMVGAVSTAALVSSVTNFNTKPPNNGSKLKTGEINPDGTDTSNVKKISPFADPGNSSAILNREESRKYNAE